MEQVICYRYFYKMKWGKFMTNYNMNFWQNTYTDMIEKSSKFMQMDTLFDKKIFEETPFKDIVTRFNELSNLVQKMSGFNVLTNLKDSSAFNFNTLFEKNNDFMNMDKICEDSMSRFKEMSQLMQKLNPVSFFMNPSDTMTYDYKKNMDGILKLVGLISIDEYQSLIKKYEELKKQSQDLEKAHTDQQKKISELNQVATAEKKKSASRDKSVDDSKSQLEEQKKIASALNKELETQKKHALSLEKELDQLKKLTESLKKDISEKEITKKKNETTKS